VPGVMTSCSSYALLLLLLLLPMMMMDMKVMLSPVGSPSLHVPALFWAPQEMVTCTRRFFAFEPFSPRLISPTALTSAIKCDSCAQPV
jgi:hypothetical protein